MKMRMRFIPLTLIALSWCILTPAWANKRVALVIGNSAYENAVTLANPERDAKAVTAKLRELGFVVVEGYDLDYDAFKDTIKEFALTVRGSEIGLFYYAGHGMQVDGRNYFVPVDAAFRDITALDFEAIPLELVTRQMQGDVSVRLVVLDACRDNPLSQTLSRSMAGLSRSTAINEGLAPVSIGEGGEGTAIIFATSPDEVALDGEGDHSPFTSAFLTHIGAPETPLQVVMSRVTGDVYRSTGQRQRPWINASLTGEVYMNPGSAAILSVDPSPKATAPSELSGIEREKILYNLALETGQLEDYQAYLDVFPDGLFSANARRQMEKLERIATERSTARVDPPAPTALPTTRTTAPEPFQLPVTDALKAAVANDTTEAALGFDRSKRKEVQTRLKLAGFDPGFADGDFGRSTRGAIGEWQKSRDIPSSGYLNGPQLELLTNQTHEALAAYMPESPPVSTAKPQPNKAKGGRPRSQNNVVSRPRKQRPGGPDSEQVGRFIGGVIGGIIRN